VPEPATAATLFLTSKSEHRSSQHPRPVAVRSDSSKRVIYAAIASNLIIAVFKCLAAFFTTGASLSRLEKSANLSRDLAEDGWRCCASAAVKDAQAQMRHSRSSTPLDIYQHFVPENQAAGGRKTQ